MNFWLIRKKVDVSWLVAVFCTSFVVGVLLSSYLHVGQNTAIVVIFLGIISTILAFYYRSYFAIFVLIIGGLIIGYWRGDIVQTQQDSFNDYYGKEIVVQGEIMDDVDEDVSQISFKLGNLRIDGNNMAGNLWITTSSAGLENGYQIEVRGKLAKGFGDISGVIYYASSRVIRVGNNSFILNIKNWFSTQVRLQIDEPMASLGLGFLVGEKNQLSTDLIQSFQYTGLTHIIVASGYNLTILVRLARRLFEKISKYLSALVSFMMMFVFVSITGFSPSMSRASLVTSLCLLAWYYGRKFHPLVILATSAGVTVGLNPAFIWGDLGWQLSFTAFFGVLVIAPLGTKYFFGDVKPNFIGQVLIETISAQIATAPIIITAFGQFSNVALIANLLILPFVPLAMLLTFIAGLVGVLLPFVHGIIGLPASWLIGLMIYISTTFASLDWAVTILSVNWLIEAICYLVIILVCIYLWRVTKYNLYDSNLVE